MAYLPHSKRVSYGTFRSSNDIVRVALVTPTADNKDNKDTRNTRESLVEICQTLIWLPSKLGVTKKMNDIEGTVSDYSIISTSILSTGKVPISPSSNGIIHHFT